MWVMRDLLAQPLFKEASILLKQAQLVLCMDVFTWDDEFLSGRPKWSTCVESKAYVGPPLFSFSHNSTFKWATFGKFPAVLTSRQIQEINSDRNPGCIFKPFVIDHLL